MESVSRALLHGVCLISASALFGVDPVGVSDSLQGVPVTRQPSPGQARLSSTLVQPMRCTHFKNMLQCILSPPCTTSACTLLSLLSWNQWPRSYVSPIRITNCTNLWIWVHLLVIKFCYTDFKELWWFYAVLLSSSFVPQFMQWECPVGSEHFCCSCSWICSIAAGSSSSPGKSTAAPRAIGRQSPSSRFWLFPKALFHLAPKGGSKDVPWPNATTALAGSSELLPGGRTSNPISEAATLRRPITQPACICDLVLVIIS